MHKSRKKKREIEYKRDAQMCMPGRNSKYIISFAYEFNKLLLLAFCLVYIQTQRDYYCVNSYSEYLILAHRVSEFDSHLIFVSYVTLSLLVYYCYFAPCACLHWEIRQSLIDSSNILCFLRCTLTCSLTLPLSLSLSIGVMTMISAFEMYALLGKESMDFLNININWVEMHTCILEIKC